VTEEEERVTRRGAAPRRRVAWGTVGAMVLVVAVAAGCGSSSSSSDTAGSTAAVGDPTTDKLAQVLARGTLVGYHERDYPPQSMDVLGAKRPADTKCTADQLTANQVEGFDADTTKLVAERLGVEACFATPSWTEVTAGNWGDRMDIAYGSGSINEDRMQRLWMTQPYYAVPNYYFVATGSPYRHASDLDGKRIGACAGCSHEAYLNGDLVIPGVDVTLNVESPQVVTFETEGPGLAATAKGKLDAFLAADPVGKAKIEEGLKLRQLPDLAFTYYPTGLVDKSSGLSVASFVAKVDEVVQQLEADGTLEAKSMKWFGRDYVTQAASYDIDALGQEVK
jgi:polar amino acid transport system substrate-binding protein